MSEQTRTGGFAPGSYECRCGYCGEWFEGDKRALACRGCAEIVKRGEQPDVAWADPSEADEFERAALPLPAAGGKGDGLQTNGAAQCGVGPADLTDQGGEP